MLKDGISKSTGSLSACLIGSNCSLLQFWNRRRRKKASVLWTKLHSSFLSGRSRERISRALQKAGQLPRSWNIQGSRIFENANLNWLAKYPDLTLFHSATTVLPMKNATSRRSKNKLPKKPISSRFQNLPQFSSDPNFATSLWILLFIHWTDTFRLLYRPTTLEDGTAKGVICIRANMNTYVYFTFC